MVKEVKKEKPDFIIHPGDHLEGMSGRPGHIYELSEVGFQQQIKKAADLYSQFGNVPMYGIDGNHDQWYFNKGDKGVVVGEELERRLKNYTHLGQDEGDLEITPKVRIKLFHPNDGSAYATSYKLQKLIESFTGGEKPEIVHQGHYHKALYMFLRNIHGFESGTMCLSPSANIITDKGKKRISKIKMGDKVLTHTGKFKKVTKTHKRMHEGELINIVGGRKSLDVTLTGTAEHPVLTTKGWVTLGNLSTDDFIFVPISTCKQCDCKIPFYRQKCNYCNPSTLNEVREKMSKSREIVERKRSAEYKKQLKKDCLEKFYNHNSDPKKHHKEIVEFAKKLKNDGYKVLPLADVIPDLISIKEGRVKIWELENGKPNYKKYEKIEEFSDFWDELEWVLTKQENNRQWGNDFRISSCGNWAIVPIISKKIVKGSRYGKTAVYNLTVEDDNSFVANNVVVHNCGQSKFMRGKKIPAHTGFGMVEVHYNKNGIDHVRHRFYPYYGDEK